MYKQFIKKTDYVLRSIDTILLNVEYGRLYFCKAMYMVKAFQSPEKKEGK